MAEELIFLKPLSVRTRPCATAGCRYPQQPLDAGLQALPNRAFSERDLAVIVDRSSAAADLIQAIRKAGKPLLEQVELVDRFEGEQLGDNKVSQAFRLRYRGKNETLTDDKIQPVHDKVRAALSKQFQAELRS